MRAYIHLNLTLTLSRPEVSTKDSFKKMKIRKYLICLNIAKRFRKVKETLGMNDDIHIHRKLNKQNKRIINPEEMKLHIKKYESAVNSTYIVVIMQMLNTDLIKIVP